MKTEKSPTNPAVPGEYGAGGGAAIIDEGALRGKIREIRGQKVMLDFELAEIYGYSTSRFNERVQENLPRFDGDDFMFRLSAEEFRNLMSEKPTSSWGGRRKPPRAFTEQGVYMLMTVLKGDLAIKQSRALIRLFKRMKDAVEEGGGLVGRREFLELSRHVSQSFAESLDIRRELREVEGDVAALVDEMGEVVHGSEIGGIIEDFGSAIERRGYLLMDGRPVEAGAAYAEIYGRARESIVVVDNYPGIRTLALLGNAPVGVSATLVTDNRGRGLRAADVDAFRAERPDMSLEVLSAGGGAVHDRYVALDFGTREEAFFLCGGSSKDAGRRITTILRAEDPGGLPRPHSAASRAAAPGPAARTERGERGLIAAGPKTRNLPSPGRRRSFAPLRMAD